MKEQKQETRNTETITISRAEYDALMEAKSQNEWLMEQLRLLKKKQSGASSEQTKEPLDGQMSLLFNEVEAYTAPPGPQKTTQVAAHTRKQSGSVKDAVPDNIPVEVVEHRLPEEERVCPQCGERMREIGTEVRETLKEEKPILDALLAWADSVSAAPKSALGKALHYLKEQRPYLLRYLKDGRLELSNNRAERSIKPFVIGRKNFLFANTPLGAQASAVIYSLIETAKETGLDSFHYLT